MGVNFGHMSFGNPHDRFGLTYIASGIVAWSNSFKIAFRVFRRAVSRRRTIQFTTEHRHTQRCKQKHILNVHIHMHILYTTHVHICVYMYMYLCENLLLYVYIHIHVYADVCRWCIRTYTWTSKVPKTMDHRLTMFG